MVLDWLESNTLSRRLATSILICGDRPCGVSINGTDH